MSFFETVALGTIAGLTIFLGLPLARLRVVAPRHMAFLNALAIGILLFLFVDIVEHAVVPIEEAIAKDASALPLLLAVLIGGFGLGLMSLVYYMHRVSAGPGFGATQLAIVIATGIGLHNFSEAFGIAGPLAGGRPSWALLGLVGIIGGGPNFLGTMIGYTFSSPPVSVLFLSVAAGALVFVIGELFASGRKLNAPLWNGWGIGIGFFAGLLTDFILIAAGA